jgi:murein DD-endopeptidase MepM/ murein hydrolase activator NlpD
MTVRLAEIQIRLAVTRRRRGCAGRAGAGGFRDFQEVDMFSYAQSPTRRRALLGAAVAAAAVLAPGPLLAGKPSAADSVGGKDPSVVADVVNRIVFRQPQGWRALTPSADAANGITVLINYAPLEEAHGTPPAGHVKIELRVASRGGLSRSAWVRQRQDAIKEPGFAPERGQTSAAQPYRLAGRSGVVFSSWGPGRVPALNLDLDWGGRALVATIVPADSPALGEALAVLDTLRDAAHAGAPPSLSLGRAPQLAARLQPLLARTLASARALAVDAATAESVSVFAATCNGPAGTFDWNEAPAVPFTLGMPFPSGSSWEVGGIGSYFGNGCHINQNNDYYATDWNRRNTGCAAGYLEDDGFEVRPAADGIVKRADCTDPSGYGCQVVVEHTTPQGVFRTRYAHMQQTSINPAQLDQPVTTGTMIGRVGCSGLPSCGPHLHLSLQQSVGGIFYSRCNGPAGQANCPNGLPKSSPQTVKPSPIQTASGSVGLADGSCYTSGTGGTTPWSLTIDDSSSSCGLYGPPQFWFTASGLGVNNQMHYTWNSQTSGTNSVNWGFTVPEAGSYRYEVFIPSDHATTASARYHIWNGSGWLGPYVVNQNNFFNAWVPLGTVSLAAGAGTVYLGDVTGEPTGTRKVGVDAVRVTRQ